MNCETAKSQVFPYVDAELAPELRDGLEAHLAGCGPCRRFVEQELRFRDAYTSRLRPDPAPAHLRESVDRLLAGLAGETSGGRWTRSRRSTHAAAAVVLLAVGLALGIALKSMLQRGDFLAELTEASVDQHQKLASGLLPPDLVGPSPKTAEAWFRRRLDFNVNVPELKSTNLTLLGARISHLANVEVAALEYQVDQRNVSLFVIPEEAYRRLGLSEKPKFKVLKHRGYDVIIWRQHGTGYALISEIGNRSCFVCHSPDEKLDAPGESFAPRHGASPNGRTDS
jgi:anti-sigma factor RsiW